ncbi:MAG: hypothetical protein ABIN08_02065 [Caldimonas sp.]
MYDAFAASTASSAPLPADMPVSHQLRAFWTLTERSSDLIVQAQKPKLYPCRGLA